MKIGNNEVSNVYVGNTNVGKIYLGNTQVFPSGATPSHDYSQDYLTFDILSSGTITLWATTTATTPVNVEYRINGGQWTSLSSSGGTDVNVVAGDKVEWRGNNPKYEYLAGHANQFTGTTYFDVSGNIMSLCAGDNFTGITASTEERIFCRLFRGCHIVNAQNLVIPLESFGDYAFVSMFTQCADLRTAPALPATTLSKECYYRMFYGTALETAPVLPATTLAEKCYCQMFYNCSNLNYVQCLAEDISASNCTYQWLYGVAGVGTFVKAAGTPWTIGDSGIPKNWDAIVDPGYDYYLDYLTFEIVSAGTVCFKAGASATPVSIEYSLNDGAWTTITSTTAGTDFNVSVGDKVRFRGNNATYGSTNGTKNSTYSNTFGGSTATFKAYGNTMSLIYGDNFASATTLTAANTFRNLFFELPLVEARHLILPATALTTSCYAGMFARCQFPVSPALPATTLAETCYWNMFMESSGMTVAPELPATTLAEGCYQAMFYKAGIEEAPELLAPVLVKKCYYQMFGYCVHLKKIKCLATNLSASQCTWGWTSTVPSGGTFIKESNTSWSRGSDGIPVGWTIQNA